MLDYVRNEQLYQKLQRNLETCEITYYDTDLSQENILYQINMIVYIYLMF